MNENETNVVEQPASIPFYVHEGEINRLERINKRFFILLLIVFFALVPAPFLLLRTRAG